MRPPIRTPALLLLALLLLAACGDASAPEPVGPDRWVRNCAGKPAPAIGKVDLRIVERLSDDRVVLEAVWDAQTVGDDRHVELVLPDGAWIVEGRRTHAAKTGEGVRRWTVGHETGRPLDAVVRLRARARGRDVGREACVRVAAREGRRGR